MPIAKTSCFVDTNILIYAVDPRETDKRRSAGDLIREATASGRLVLSPQSLNECYRTLTDKLKIADRAEAREYCALFAPFCVAPLNFAAIERAWRIQDETGFSWWDCVLLASASLAGCEVFYSEDLQHGRRVGGVEIRNPFAAL